MLRTFIGEASFGDRDVWNEESELPLKAHTIGEIARGYLAKRLQAQPGDLLISAVAVDRFAHTKYWFFEVSLFRGNDQSRKTLTVLVRLNGDIIPFTSDNGRH